MTQRSRPSANRFATADGQETSAAGLLRRIPAIATAWRVQPPARCCPPRRGNAPRPTCGRSPTPGIAKSRWRRPHLPYWADRMTAGRPAQANRLCVCVALRPAPPFPSLRRLPPTHRTCGTPHRAHRQDSGRPLPENVRCPWQGRQLSAPEWHQGSDHHPGCVARSAAPMSRVPGTARMRAVCSRSLSSFVPTRRAERSARRGCPRSIRLAAAYHAAPAQPLRACRAAAVTSEQPQCQVQARAGPRRSGLSLRRPANHSVPARVPFPSVSSTTADRAAEPPRAHPTRADQATVSPPRQTARRRVVQWTTRCTTNRRGMHETPGAVRPPACTPCDDHGRATAARARRVRDWVRAHDATGQLRQS